MAKFMSTVTETTVYCTSQVNPCFCLPSSPWPQLEHGHAIKQHSIAVFKITARPRTENIRNEAGPAKVPSKLVQMSGKISRKFFVIIVHNMLWTCGLARFPLVHQHLLNCGTECPIKSKSLLVFWRLNCLSYDRIVQKFAVNKIY